MLGLLNSLTVTSHGLCRGNAKKDKQSIIKCTELIRLKSFVLYKYAILKCIKYNSKLNITKQCIANSGAHPLNKCLSQWGHDRKFLRNTALKCVIPVILFVFCNVHMNYKANVNMYFHILYFYVDQ